MYSVMLNQVSLCVKRGVAFVRNVFCFKAAEHFASSENLNKTSIINVNLKREFKEGESIKDIKRYVEDTILLLYPVSHYSDFSLSKQKRSEPPCKVRLNLHLDVLL